MTTIQANMQSALAYAKSGFRVFPLKPRGKTPLTPHGHKDATTDLDTIRKWWQQYPLANIGIETTGLLVPDFDGLDGIQSLALIKDKYGELPRTWTVKTGGGTEAEPKEQGRQYIYRVSADLNIRPGAGKYGYPGLDIRANDSYIVAVPSVTRLAYETIDNLPVANAPEWLMTIAMAAGSSSKPGPTTPIRTKIYEGKGRNAALTSEAGRLLNIYKSPEIVKSMVEAYNQAVCIPPLSKEESERTWQKSLQKWTAKETPRNRKMKDTEVEAIEKSFLAVGHCLYEQIVSNGQSAFIEYDLNTDESKTVTHIMQGEVKVIPLSSEEIMLGAVKLPSGIAEYGDTLYLLKEIESHIYHYLDVSDSFRKFASYYILLSWVYDQFNTLPYLRFIGDTGCGKSRGLDVIGGLCYKSTSASGCITPAPIYRMLKRWAGTLILDEADLRNSDEYHEVIKILNCGFERNRPVIRAVKDNPDRLQILPTFGPKVFATRQRFKDPALEARCLTEIMQETAREDIPATLASAFHKEQDSLRNKLLLFRLRNYNHINSDTFTLDLQGIEPRLRQISACFAALFAGQASVLADYRIFISHHQRELIEQRAATTVGQVVEKLFALMESDGIDTFDSLDTTLISVSAGDIAESLNMTAQAAGQILKTLGLQTKFIKAKSKRCIVYDQLKLDILRRRYIPTRDDEVSLVSMVSNASDSIQNDTKPSEDLHSANVFPTLTGKKRRADRETDGDVLKI